MKLDDILITLGWGILVGSIITHAIEKHRYSNKVFAERLQQELITHQNELRKELSERQDKEHAFMLVSQTFNAFAEYYRTNGYRQ